MGQINTYDSAAEAEADRAQQKALLMALNAWDRALRRDEAGAWAICGKHGSIHTWGNGKCWALYVTCNSGQQWTWAKKKLAFCSVTQDAEEEGVLRLDQLPTPAQAEAIRDALGIQKRREVSAGVLERLRSFAFERKPGSEPTLEPNIGLGERQPPVMPILVQTPVLDPETGPLR